MKRAVVVNILLLIVGAALAFAAFEKEQAPPKEDKPPPVIATTLDGVKKVEFTSPDGSLTVERLKDGSFGATLVRDVPIRPPEDDAKKDDAKKDDAKKNDAKDRGADAGPEVEEAPPPTERKTFRFPLANRVTKSLEKLAPLETRRVLDDVAEQRLVNMGFDEDQATFTLTDASGTTTLKVGDKTYGGAARYVQGPGGTVYLVDSSAFSGLEGNEMRLAERRVLAVPLSLVTKAAFAVGEQTASFVHNNRDDAKERFFARAETPEDAHTEAKNAVTFLRRQRVKKFVAGKSIPEGARAVRAVFQISRAEGRPVEGRFLGVDGDEAYVQLGGFTAALDKDDAQEAIDLLQSCL